MTVTVPLEMALRAIDWRAIAAFFRAGDARRQRCGVFYAAPERRRTAAPDSLAVALGGVRALMPMRRSGAPW